LKKRVFTRARASGELASEPAVRGEKNQKSVFLLLHSYPTPPIKSCLGLLPYAYLQAVEPYRPSAHIK